MISHNFNVSSSGLQLWSGLYNLTRFVISLVGVQLSQSKLVVRSRVGQRAVLECDPQGDQPITVTWTRHGSPITREQQKYFKVNKLKQTSKYFFFIDSRIGIGYTSLSSFYFEHGNYSTYII